MPLLPMRARLFTLACTLALAGCAPAAPAAPTAPPTTLPSATPTIAFPTLIPSATLAPPVTPTAPAGPAGAAGPVLFEAGFTSDEGWLLSSDADGAASLSRQSLVIAIARPNASRFVLVPTSPATDFLLEASIRADLCAVEDEIGLLFRATPSAEHYRFTLSCGGVVRVTRVLGSRAAVIAGPQEASTALLGSPVENRLAVFARGPAFTFFINGAEVLSARDTQLISGGFGFVGRSASQGQTTAALTSLSVRALPPTPTVTPRSG
jgi:hypothetical protein